MIKLTEEDKETIKSLGYPKVVNLSCGSYLVKLEFESTGINELIGKKLADIFEIICPNYDLVEIDDARYIFSEDLNKIGKFVGADVLEGNNDYLTYSLKDLYKNDAWYDKDAEGILHGNSLYDIWSYLEKNYSTKVSRELMQDIVKIYIYDVLFFNFDRGTRNWGILTLNDEPRIVMFDHEFMFNIDAEDSKTLLMNVNFLEKKSDLYDDFRYFLKESSSEFVSLFKYYFDLVTPELLSQIIKSVELKIETNNRETSKAKAEEASVNDESNNKKQIDSEKLIRIYTEHREKLLNIYNEELKKEEPHAR